LNRERSQHSGGNGRIEVAKLAGADPGVEDPGNVIREWRHYLRGVQRGEIGELSLLGAQEAGGGKRWLTGEELPLLINGGAQLSGC
jgi:hypothetical protein